MPQTLLYAILAWAVVPIVAILVWILKVLEKETIRRNQKGDLLDIAVGEYILRLQVENRQLRELLNLREKDWEKKV